MLNVVLLTMSPTHSTAELSRYQNTLDGERLSSKKENSLHDDKRLHFRIALPISNGQSSHDIRPSSSDDTSSFIDDDNTELSENEMIIQKHRRDRITVTNSDRSKFNFNDDSLMLQTPMPSLITDDEIVISSKDWNDQDDDRGNNDENSDESSITIPLSPFEIQFHPMRNILSSRSLKLFNDESNILLKQLVTSGTDEEKGSISFSLDVISQTLTSPDDNDNNNRRRYHHRHLVFLQPPSSSSQQHKNSQRIINGRIRRRLNDDMTLSITLNNTGIITSPSLSSSSNNNNGDEQQRLKGGVFAATTHSNGNNNATLSSSSSSIPTVDDLNGLIQSFFENDVQLANLRDRLQLLEPESFELLDSIEFKGFVTTTSSSSTTTATTPKTTSESDDVKIVMTGATLPTDEDNSNDDSFPMMIVIIGVGVGCVLLIIGVVLWSFNKKKRSHRSSSNSGSSRRAKSRRLSEEERGKTNRSIDSMISNSGSRNEETLSCNSSNEHEMESMHSSHPQDNNNNHHHMLTNVDNDADDDEDVNPQEVLTMLQKRLSGRYAIYLGGTTPGPEDERYLRIITRLPITAVAPYPNVAKWAFELSTYAFECEKSGKRECDFFAGNGGLPAGESRDDTVDRRAKGVGNNHTRQRWNSPPSIIGSSNSISEEERKRAEDLERKKLLRRLERWRKNEHVYLHREAMRRSLLDEDKPPQPILLRPMTNANNTGATTAGRQDVDDMANEAYHRTLFQNKQNLKHSTAVVTASKRNNACATTALQLRSRQGQDEWDKCMLLTGAGTMASSTSGGNGSHRKQHQQQQQQQQMESFKIPFFFQCKE